ncbi:hypothetical protein FAM09_23125 [Niastella caeni]|uniref:Signal transduction histidine kinase internal region domain-containing protein n=1 Tax=Niastella caeni TaxID=2569763 RepID=A0A4S8HI52_9BACT|nr:histidine kinase [Niastella caeni]THU34888.1 hypothetical protein FAM09_23125 [Niastella caeni]
MLKPVFAYIVLLLAAPCTMTAQAPAIAPLPFKTLTVADGLPQAFISGLVQDQQGFIWIGTRDGLARYDGIQFKLYNHLPGDTGSLAANTISNLYIDRHSRLWIVYESGDIDILNTITEVLFHFSRHLAYKAIYRKLKGYGSVVQSVAEDGNGNIWMPAQNGGVFIYNPVQNSLQFFSDSALNLHKNRISGITSMRGNILLVTDTALVTMNTNRQIIDIKPYHFNRPHLFNARTPWKDNRPIVRSNGDIVIPDEDRLLIYKANRRLFTVMPLPRQTIYLTSPMVMDDKENIYFDNNGIIYMLSPDNRLQVWRPRKGRNPNTISMLFDCSGILWTGGNASGITLYDLRLPHINGFPYNHDFFQDVLQRYAMVPAGNMQSAFINTADNFMIRHATAKDGAIWFSVSGGDTAFTSKLCYLYKGRMNTMVFNYASATAPRHTGIPGLAFSKKGMLWGIDSRFRPVHFNINTRTVSVYPSLYPLSGFNDLLIDGENIFWITSMSHGLFRYDMTTQKLQHFEQNDVPGQLPSGQLLDMENDPDDSTIMWIASLGGGLIRFDKTTNRARCFTTKDGLPNNTVYAIVPDSRGIFWCSSNKGIFSFNPRTAEVRSFTTKDGLLNDEFNRYQFLQLPNGMIAFGGVGSYTAFDPLAINADEFEPHVVLTGLSINNEHADYGQPGSPFSQSVNSLSQITLPWHKNFLSFSFAALEYNIPGKLQYRYRLTGIDEKWVYAQSGNTATYTNVPQGSYELQINATNTSGKWSSHVKKMRLVIIPPLWKTAWFLTSVVILSALLVFLIIYSRIKSIRKKEKQQLRVERELMELEAGALRAQMNPHFIFNCLSAIKLLIQEDKKQEAITYLTTFSKLIRNQLHNSQKEISLEEELKTCRLYLQMEALRFGPGLTFDFEVEEEANIYSLMVPPLLIQPFIENAIWHGILPREKGGKVTIKVTDREDHVLCIIDDDGIGREQSMRNKLAIADAHASQGLQLTQNRMHLYNVLYQRGANITITDKINAQGVPCGTIATISFKKEV